MTSNSGATWPDDKHGWATCFVQAVPSVVMQKKTIKLSAKISGSGLESSLVIDLEEAIRVLLKTGHPSIDRVAYGLDLSTRTLQRRLREQGLTYSQLIEFVRQREAHRKLRATNESVAQIAIALGYADPSSFSRAFRRWAGRSPSAYRRQSVSASDDQYPVLGR